MQGTNFYHGLGRMLLLSSTAMALKSTPGEMMTRSDTLVTFRNKL